MRGAFAYAPLPAVDELLGSWVHRVAIAHGVNGSVFLQDDAEDLDWSAREELLRWLSKGAELPISVLRSMTLSCREPISSREQFAMASGTCFPGCHAYCPRCGLRDRVTHLEAVQRHENAGRWRMACREHRLLLDGVDTEDELTPASRRPKRVWLDGRLPVGREMEAPNFVFAFERAIGIAERGARVSNSWAVSTPDAFVKIARLIANFALLRHQLCGRRESAAGALFEGRLSSRIGVDVFDPEVIDRASTRVRVRALTVTALLMLSPTGATKFCVADWPPLQSLCEWRLPTYTPWEAAMAPWRWGVLDQLIEFSAGLPQGLRHQIEGILLPRLKFLNR